MIWERSPSSAIMFSSRASERTSALRRGPLALFRLIFDQRGTVVVVVVVLLPVDPVEWQTWTEPKAPSASVRLV